MMPETTDMLTWAKWWVQQGWAVHPLGVREKEPVTQNGFKDATQDIAQLELWWGQNPDYNIGGVPPEGKFAVDVDGPTDIDFPPTWEHRTANGRHLVYEQHPLNPVPHGQKIWPHVDTRCHGKGYVVLPPSVHPSGKRYELVGVRSIEVFPSTIKPPVKPKRGRPRKDGPTEVESIASTILFEGVDGTGRDDTMIKIAGYLARYVPNEDAFAALLTAINRGWVDPLDESALGKKFLLFKRHQEVVAEKTAKALDDESRGWLFERSEPDHGYDTPIEGRDGTVTFMPITDFTMRATGVVVAPGFTKRTYIVDITRADGTVMVGEKIDSDTLVDGNRLKKWLGRRALGSYDNHRKDPRQGSLGMRILKMLISQEPIELESRDHYGWCKETQAFLIEQGEVTPDGLRGFTNVYPDDRLRTDAPTAFRFDADSAQAREWLSRVLALQPEREAAKVGAWAMMLLLRGQWDGLMPGLLVQASAGTGKTRFFQLLFKLLGSTNTGESLTVAAMRDKLTGNTSNAVWLDDVHLNDKQQELMRGAITNGKVTLKTSGADGWETTEKQMRASIVVSGEGVDWYRQKALRDRFVEIEFDMSIRTPDADKLVTEDIGKASGALLMLVLQAADQLPALEALRHGVSTRDLHARTTLRMGAEILDAVLGTGAKWTTIVGDWYRDAPAEDLGQASENVLYVFPTLWTRLKHPRTPGAGTEINPIWYDEMSKRFWVHAQMTSDKFLQTEKNLNDRIRQLASQNGITMELDACGASHAENKRTRTIGGTSKQVKYRPLPVEYSAHVLRAADMYGIEDDE